MNLDTTVILAMVLGFIMGVIFAGTLSIALLYREARKFQKARERLEKR